MASNPTCPECSGPNLVSHGGIDARGGYGPDLLPGASGVFRSAKMRVVVCKDCGSVRFFATQETLEKIRADSGWQRVM